MQDTRSTMQMKPLSLAIAAISMSSAMLSSGVLAQSETVRLEEIVVTAQKRQQTVQDVPSSIAALDEQLLNKTNTTNFDDLGKISSGLNISAQQDGFSNIIRIRGVGTNTFTPAIRPAVGIFVDEIPLVRTEAAFNNLADIQRIEVLKGPQATLFGKEVSSGAISLFSKRPHTDSVEAFGELNAGNNDLVELRGGFNLPLTDSLGLRASAYDTEKSADSKNILTGKSPDINANGFRVRLLWEPSSEFNAIVTYEENDSLVKNSNAERVSNGSLTDRVATLEPDAFDGKTEVLGPQERDVDSKLTALHMEWQINDDWSFTSVTGYQKWKQFIDGDRAQGSANGSTSPAEALLFVNDTADESLTQEFRFLFDGESLSSIIGVFYADSEGSLDNSILLDTGFSVGGNDIKSASLSLRDTEVNDRGIFTHNTYALTDELELTFGLRYSEVEREAVSARLTGHGLFASPNGHFGQVSTWQPPTQKETWEAITGSLKLSYDVNENVTVYTGFDRGFKAGGFNTAFQDRTPIAPPARTFDPSAVIVPPSFDPEYAHSFEIGFKSNLLDHTLRWSGAIFYQTYDDYQVEVPDGVFGVTIKNAAEVEIQGIETDLVWQIDQHWRMDGNLAYIDSRFGDYEEAGCILPQYERIQCASGSQDLSGKRLNATSPWSANINATYSSWFENGLNWYARAETAFRDDRVDFPDLDPVSKQSSYILYNASAGLMAEDESWEVILWGKNLTDEDYVSQYVRSRDGGSGPTAVEGVLAYVGEGRTYGLTLKYRYD